jgi:phospholipase/carboxylesterase
MWLDETLQLAHPEVIVSGREFARIHPDRSLHAPLPFERALELAEKGWGERHSWADQREGWDGFVMLFTPQSMDELQARLVFGRNQFRAELVLWKSRMNRF